MLLETIGYCLRCECCLVGYCLVGLVLVFALVDYISVLMVRAGWLMYLDFGDVVAWLWCACSEVVRVLWFCMLV